MTQLVIYSILTAALIGVGLRALVIRKHIVRKVMALNVIGSAVFLLLIVIAASGDGGNTDPVPHAMVLTGIVVAVSTTALALAIARRIHAQSGRGRLSETEGLE